MSVNACARFAGFQSKRHIEIHAGGDVQTGLYAGRKIDGDIFPFLGKT